MPNRFHKGFTDLTDEVHIESLPVTGEIPRWVAGTLIRNGPGRFSTGTTSYRHWFDGLAMLRAFWISDGSVSYANRYLRTDSYADDLATDQVTYRGFAVDPCMTRFQRAMAIFIRPKLGTNPVINIVKAAGQFIAMTEATLAVEFDPKTLETIREVQYTEDGGKISADTATAHPHYDAARGVGYNYMLQIGAIMKYQLHTQQGSDHHKLFERAVREPTYMHSFGMSDRYLILSEYPFVLPQRNLLTLATVSKPFIENFVWQPERGTRFMVIDKVTGACVADVRGEAVFAFHHINAYEEDETLIVDLCGYPDATVIDGLYLESVRRDPYINQAGHVMRFRIPLQGTNERLTAERIGTSNIELPRIHYSAHSGKPYQYVYGVSLHDGMQDFTNQLVKINVQTGETAIWFVDGYYPSEPVFVPAPDATTEDDGVLLSVVLDSTAEHSFLLVLDATTMTEIARAELPHALPFSFHGQFFNVRTFKL